MSPRVKQLVFNWSGIAAFLTVLGATVAFGRREALLEQKLDASRFVQDSINRSNEREQDRQILLRIDKRVRDMYCADKPPGCQ